MANIVGTDPGSDYLTDSIGGGYTFFDFDGNDTIDGGDGHVLYGYAGNATLVGGQGDDPFNFDAHGAPTADTILDFQTGTDQLLFSQAVFITLGGAGTVPAGRIQVASISPINAISGSAGDGTGYGTSSSM